ncbi:hypothetical protein BKA57DRAFT_540084 [Linnemannia elongata]|nr:hypothetical protein BKA57DRAFT_540084 [Linnemannia elongata]
MRSMSVGSLLSVALNRFIGACRSPIATWIQSGTSRTYCEASPPRACCLSGRQSSGPQSRLHRRSCTSCWLPGGTGLGADLETSVFGDNCMGAGARHHYKRQDTQVHWPSRRLEQRLWLYHPSWFLSLRRFASRT